MDTMLCKSIIVQKWPKLLYARIKLSKLVPILLFVPNGTLKGTMPITLSEKPSHFKFTGSTAAGPCTGPVHSWEEPPAGLLWQGPWLPAVPALGHPAERVHLGQSGPSGRSRAQRRRGENDGLGSWVQIVYNKCGQQSMHVHNVWTISLHWRKVVIKNANCCVCVCTRHNTNVTASIPKETNCMAYTLLGHISHWNTFCRFKKHVREYIGWYNVPLYHCVDWMLAIYSLSVYMWWWWCMCVCGGGGITSESSCMSWTKTSTLA